jgi:hypothetical protein
VVDLEKKVLALEEHGKRLSSELEVARKRNFDLEKLVRVISVEILSHPTE